LTDSGRHDPLFAQLPADPLVFLWHTDAFALPAGSTLLATGGPTPHQAFRYGSRAYGLQYHIELTADLFAAWLSDNGAELAELRGVGAGPVLEAEWVKYHAEYQQQACVMFYNFLRLARVIADETT